MKAPDQPQSAAEESLLTRDITQLLVQRFVFFIKIESNSRFSKTYSEIESTWPINSSKEEIVLSRDSKKLFAQHFVKAFDQNRKQVETRNHRTGTLADFAVATIVGLSEAATRGVVSERYLQKFCNVHRKHLCWSLFLKKLQNLRPSTLCKRDPNKAVFLWILQNF